MKYPKKYRKGGKNPKNTEPNGNLPILILSIPLPFPGFLERPNFFPAAPRLGRAGRAISS